jgi:sigma-E factor negative regulatory protein RseB
VYMHDGQVESIKLVHKQGKNGEIQRIVHLSGEPREVIKDNDVVTCYMPDTHSVFVGKRRFNSHLLTRLTKDFHSFGDQYQIELDGQGRIAERQTVNIAIRPKDVYRYGHRFWIDSSSGLLLKSELMDTHWKPLEQLMFVDINIVDVIPQHMLKPGITGESFVWHNGRGKSKVIQNESKPLWQIKNLPAGFAIEDRSQQNFPNKKTPVDSLVVSDGLASISVFIEQFDHANESMVGPSRMGVINVYSSLFDNHHVTVVGEAPQGTIKMIAESVSDR